MPNRILFQGQKLRDLADLVKSGVALLREGLSRANFQPGRAISKFPVNAKLKQIGHFSFSRLPFSSWRMSLNIKFENHPESAVPFELIPMLTIGNTYDGKESFPPEETTELVGQISKPKSHVQDKHGNWWAAFNHSKGLIVYVRQLELAKLLHLHNAHLVRAAFRPSGLASMAHVESIQETTIIRFSTLADYPASNLNYQRERVHLAWLYLDEDARRSFESIYRYMQGRSDENWHFQFDPPPMKDWTLRARGYFTKRGDFIVESIKKIKHPGFSRHQNVIFMHPRYKKMIPVFDQGDTGAANNPKIENNKKNVSGIL